MIGIPNLANISSPWEDKNPVQIPWGVPGQADPRLMQASYSPQGMSNLTPYSVPVAPVDQQFNIPTQGMPQQSPQGPDPKLQGVSAVLGQYLQNRQTQQNSGGLTEQILAQRFQPQMQDVSRSITQTQQAYGAPDLYKPINPYEAANARGMSELSPYTAMADLQSKIGTGTMNTAGGATGVLANRIMQEAQSNGQPMSFMQALQMAQTGFRNNTMIDANGNVVAMPGALQTIANKSNANQTGQNISDLAYKPQIAGQEASQKTGVELANAAPIAAQTKRGEALGAAQGVNDRRSVQAPQILSLLDQADAILPQATSGGLATTMRDAQGYFGRATPGSEADSQLNVISAALVQNVPRMEGPQSDRDVALYQKAAGDIGNSALPIRVRMSASKIIRQIQQKYANLNAAPQMEQSQLNSMPSGTNPTPPTPDQISGGGVTHSFDPATGQLVPVQ